MVVSCDAGFGFASPSATADSSYSLGSTLDDGTCTPCSKGTFKDQAGATLCSPCGAGKYVNVSSATLCFDCSIGRHLEDASGQIDAHDDVNDCSACPVLTYNPVEGLGEACYPCLSAKTTGTTECGECVGRGFFYYCSLYHTSHFFFLLSLF